MRPIQRFLVLLSFALSLLGCAGVEKLRPLDLGPNVALIDIDTVWRSQIGRVDFPLQIKVVGDTIFLADSAGQVVALDARTGADIWRVSLGTPLSAGVGSDGHFVAVVSRDNELITLVDGRQTWRQKLSALTLSAPLVAGDRIFVMSSDRTVSAFDASSGRRLWQQQRSSDALVLGQAGLVFALGDTLVTGLGGRLTGLNPMDGNTRWASSIASSRGTNEIERLVDLVAGVSRAGDQVCVRAFQAAVGCVDGNNGALLWSKPASGFTGLHGDETLVVGVERDGQIVAWHRDDGEIFWMTDVLRFRSLSTPLMVGQLIVVGDELGQLYFLSREDTEILTRIPTDGSAVLAAPVVVGNTLVVVTQNGGVFGLRPAFNLGPSQ